ncbi:probable serine/threonine-protein kinase dyrk1 isoform X2 [Tigriopus californicus]|nr:probable serine/threonine-protein kinase dyrk1 isoform X2 [Tigriopus californicus]
MEEVEELKCKGQCNNPLESVAGSEWKQYDMYIAIGALILSVIFLSLWIRRERRQQQQQQQHQQQQRLPKPTGQKSNHELGPESQELESNYICEVVMDNDYYQRTVLANKNSSQESEGHYNENDYVAVL